MSDSSKKYPKKTTPKRQTKKTVKSKQESLSSVNVEEESHVITNKHEQINIDNLIKQALTRYKEDILLDQTHKTKELTHLASMCEEYLSTYAIIGYSLQNEKIAIFNTPTQKDEAALVDLIRSTFLEIIQNRL